jgi:hypothetical protein
MVANARKTIRGNESPRLRSVLKVPEKCATPGKSLTNGPDVSVVQLLFQLLSLTSKIPIVTQKLVDRNVRTDLGRGFSRSRTFSGTFHSRVSFRTSVPLNCGLLADNCQVKLRPCRNHIPGSILSFESKRINSSPQTSSSRIMFARTLHAAIVIGICMTNDLVLLYLRLLNFKS